MPRPSPPATRGWSASSTRTVTRPLRPWGSAESAADPGRRGAVEPDLPDARDRARRSPSGPQRRSTSWATAARATSCPPSRTGTGSCGPAPPRFPGAGTNTIIVTHLPNIEYAFGDSASDVAEGEALVVRPDGRGRDAGRADQDRGVAASRRAALAKKISLVISDAVDLAALPFVASVAESVKEEGEWRVRPRNCGSRRRKRGEPKRAGRTRKRASVLVATRKGAWLYHGDGARKTWRADGPHFLGHIINHVVLDPRDGRTLLAAAKTGHLGPDRVPLDRPRPHLEGSGKAARVRQGRERRRRAARSITRSG